MTRNLLAVLLACCLSSTQASAQDSLRAPDDPLFDSQWYLFSPDDPRGEPGSINAVASWERIKPAEPIVIAVVGSGVNFTHPELAENVWRNPKEELNQRDDDANGFVDDIHGWDFTTNDMNPTSQAKGDSADHDSMVASIIAAVPNNGRGIAGIGRNVRIMPVRTLGDYAPLQAAGDGLRYAIRNGAKVIVFNGHSPQFLQFIMPALREAEAAGVLVVMGAGNKYDHDIDDEVQELADLSNILLVTGSRKDGSWAGMARGQLVTVAAPCEEMKLLSYNTYESVPHRGASWAAPIAAAVAGTLLSQEPELTPKQVIERVQRCSVMHESMRGRLGGGRIDMLRVIEDVSDQP